MANGAVLLALAGLAVVVAVVGILIRKRLLFKERSAWHIGIGAYHIRSYDGGKTWVSVETVNGKLIEVGPADPDVVRTVNAVDGIDAYVRKHGTITKWNDTTIQLFRDAHYLDGMEPKRD